MEKTRHCVECFWGLHPHVRYRIELGFVFADDGSRLWKLNARIIEALCKGGALKDVCDEMALVEHAVIANPTLFRQYQDSASAIASLLNQEI
jgi:hypothetical protein